MKIIECNNLIKNYPMPKLITHVLKDINLQINKGDFCGITGQSGSGKTTLLYVMSGLEKPTSGNVLIYDKLISDYDNKEISELRKHHLGFVFQFFNLIQNLTVYENILLSLVISKNKNEKYIDHVLDLVKMGEFKNYYPNELSGGMQQRVAIARCLVNDPEIIFADEPTGNLDNQNGIEIMNILKMLNVEKNKTVVLVTHSEDNLKYCNRHLKLIDGKIIKDEKLTF